MYTYDTQTVAGFAVERLMATLPDGTNCIIEANTSSGVNIIQLWGGQRNGELGDFYRHYGVIR